MSGLDALLAGHTLADRYRIDEVIGRGGFAVVYEGYDERLHRTVAVKVIMLSAPHGAAGETRARFEREARASAGLQHPNVAAVYDFGTDPTLGLDFLVMERLTGQDLRARLAAPEPVPLDEGLRIMAGAAAGVAAGHRAGIIHRDVKPANIFLAHQPGAARTRVCVLDFGIALLAQGDDTRLTQHGVPLSVAYAAPEQLAGERELTPAADVFALGVVAYELLGGRRPYSADPLRAAEERQSPPTDLRAQNPAVPPHVAAAVARALAHDPAERFADAGGFGAALGAAPGPAGVEPVAAAANAPPPAPAKPSQPARGRRRGLPLALVALLVIALVAAALLLTHGRQGERVAMARTPSSASGADDEQRPPRSPAPRPAPGTAAQTAPGTATRRASRGDQPAAPVARGVPATAPNPRVAPPPSPPPAPNPPAPPPSPPAAATPVARPPARATHAEASPALPPSGAEFRENLSHPCQSRGDAGAALACLNRDLDAADGELNSAYHDAMARLDGPRRQALLDSQRAWLARYDAVITSYYSRPWAGHSRIRVLPSQIQALRDRTAYLRRVASG